MNPSVVGQKFYITTAIDYVNAAPHLGHAYEKIASDVLARFYRLTGKSVFFLTGTDEHGSKVEKTARSKGMEPKAYTDLISEHFKTAWADLNLTYDRFIRTTDPEHYEVVKQIWETLQAQGDIYKAPYTGLYCSGCENFVTQRDLTETGECPHHLVKPEPIEEENYFFRLTQYKQAIQEHIAQNPEFIRPHYRRDEVLRLLDDLEDISVSRSIHSVTWGIPVPGDDSQRIYVWIDALSNYLTGCGYLQNAEQFSQLWPADVHMIGKDILRFHAIYWPAMLMAAKLPLPGCVFAHGFITFNDSKISKSTGNIVSPSALVERFELSNTDPIRYYLMTCSTFGQDGNFTEEEFKNKINADLANNLGNLLNRTLNMTLKYFEGQVPQSQLSEGSHQFLTQTAQEVFDH
ncbi:MAG: class I tRNA ligase family protein, partial [Cyanobacteria bacterium]|nr:class I tRNA ligase family protein [Cyanobacteriota bacterium]